VRADNAAHQKTWRPLTTEIVQASVFATSVQELKDIAAGKFDGYMYTRYANPTTRAAEEQIAKLEGAEDCIVSASGQAAMFTAVLATCRAGDEIVAMQDLYGGTLKLLSEVLSGLAINVTLVPFSELPRFAEYLSDKTRLAILESPTNPTLRVADLKALCTQAHARGVLTLVDNTFATPMSQQPLSFGADIVMHSATKYLGGHSDLSAGALCGSRELMARCRKVHILAGGVLDPHASYLLIRGIKTLSIRMERACDNARQLAEALTYHPQVSRVYYPGMGAMVSIEVKGGAAAAERLLCSTKLWTFAASLGGVESTMSYPVLASHTGLEDQWEALGITPALVRLSVGIEAYEDLIADLEQALA